MFQLKVRFDLSTYVYSIFIVNSIDLKSIFIHYTYIFLSLFITNIWHDLKKSELKIEISIEISEVELRFTLFLKIKIIICTTSVLMIQIYIIDNFVV